MKFGRHQREFSIRRGDIWDLRTNRGILRRTVKSVACGVVSYMNCEGSFCKCGIYNFKRWAFGAGLHFAENWEGRDNNGNDRG